MTRLAGGRRGRLLCWTSVRRTETPGHFACSRSHCGSQPSVAPHPGNLASSPPSGPVAGGAGAGTGVGEAGAGGDSSDIQRGRQSRSMTAADRRTAWLVSDLPESEERRAGWCGDSGPACSCLTRDICSAGSRGTRGRKHRWSSAGETPGTLGTKERSVEWSSSCRACGF